VYTFVGGLKRSKQTHQPNRRCSRILRRPNRHAIYEWKEGAKRKEKKKGPFLCMRQIDNKSNKLEKAIEREAGKGPKQVEIREY